MMKKVFNVAVLILFLFQNGTISAQKWEWVEQIGLDIGGNDGGNDILIDGNGDVCVVGVVKGDSKFGNEDSSVILDAYGTHDIFLSKYDNLGNFKWARRHGSTGTDMAMDFICDINSNWFLGGYFSLECDFEDTILTSNGLTDCFVMSVDSEGEFRWIYSFGGNGDDKIWALDGDEYGNTYASGYFSDTLYFGDTSIVSSGDWDLFVAKINMEGVPIWIKGYGGEGRDVCHDLSLRNENLFLTGYFTGAAFFDDYEIQVHGSNPNSRDIFICRIDSTGIVDWVINEGGGSNDYGLSIDVDNNNRIVVGGVFRYLANFNEDQLVLNSVGLDDMFISRYLDSGEFIDAVSFGSDDEDDLNTIEIDKMNNINIGGHFRDTLIISDNSFSSIGPNDIFIIQLNDTLGFNWIKQVEGVPYGGKEPGCKALVSDSLMNLYATGGFLTDVYFDSIYMEAYGISRDAFIGKLRPKLKGSFYTETIIECEYNSIEFYNNSNYIATDFEWIFEGADTVISNEINPIVSYYSSGTYDVTLIVHGDNQSDTVFMQDYITILPIPEINLGVDLYACEGEVLFISVDDIYSSYLWSTGDTLSNISVSSSSNVWLQVSNSNNCTNIDSLNTLFWDLSEVNLGQDTIICEGADITLYVDSTFQNYLWSTGDTISYITVNELGDYWVNIVNENGCVSGDTIFIEVDVCTNVNDIILEDEIGIYPNPFRNSLTIEFGEVNTKLLSVEVLSSNGKLLYRYDNMVLETLSIHNLEMPSGNYYLVIEFIDGTKFTKKIIKL